MAWCKWLLGCIPVIAVVAIMNWSYYTYIKFCQSMVHSSEKKAIYMTFYHIVLVLMVWGYFKVMCTGAAFVPYEFKVPRHIYERIKGTTGDADKNELLIDFCQKRDIVVVTRNEFGNIRFCNRCKHIKPDRAHHCSTCGTCILKMDHHCPWVHNCIGFTNYKAFVVFLAYATLYCAFYAGTTLEHFINFLYQHSRSYDEIQVFIGFIVSAGLGSLVFSFFCYHMSLIAKNETTLEALRGPIFRNYNENLTFDIGVCPNFAEVFGDHCILWIIPEGGSKGDGVHYPVRLIF